MHIEKGKIKAKERVRLFTTLLSKRAGTNSNNAKFSFSYSNGEDENHAADGK
jgi:hypothetical protein